MKKQPKKDERKHKSTNDFLLFSLQVLLVTVGSVSDRSSGHYFWLGGCHGNAGGRQ